MVYDFSHFMFVQIALFIGSMGYMEGRDSGHIKDKYRDMYFPALQANWQVWPLVQVCIWYIFDDSTQLTMTVAGELPVYAAALSSAIPVYMWCILDAVSVHPELAGR
jgi:hypothetical protein